MGAAVFFVAPDFSFAAPDPTREAREAEAEAWSFALALTTGFTLQDQSGQITPEADVNLATVQPGTKVPAPLRSPSSGVYSAVTPNFGMNLEVMAPEFGWVPGDPRLFANAEIYANFPSDGTLAVEGSATEFTLPEKIENNPVLWPQEAVTGTGSRLNASVSRWTYAAHLGLAFPVEIRGRLVRIKPTVGWINFGVESTGRLLAAYKNDPDPPRIAPPLYGTDARFITLQNAADARFNAIGPGLEMEMELAKFHGFRPSIYAQGNAYRMVGTSSITIEDEVFVDDALGEASYTTAWRMDLADWVYRAALGFRFRWVGGD